MTKEKTLYCSFCGKSQHEVAQLIVADTGAAICNECCLECAMLIVDAEKRATANYPCGSLGEEV